MWEYLLTSRYGLFIITWIAVAKPEGNGEHTIGNGLLARLAQCGQDVEHEEGQPGRYEGGHYKADN